MGVFLIASLPVNALRTVHNVCIVSYSFKLKYKVNECKKLILLSCNVSSQIKFVVIYNLDAYLCKVSIFIRTNTTVPWFKQTCLDLTSASLKARNPTLGQKRYKIDTEVDYAFKNYLHYCSHYLKYKQYYNWGTTTSVVIRQQIY